jgi:hypothetical protein
VRHTTAGSVYRTAARLALAVAVLAVALCAWEVLTARGGAADAQAAAAAAQNDAAVAQAITSLQLAELNDVIQPTATSQSQLVMLSRRTRVGVIALAARIEPSAPAAAARLRVEAQALDSQIHKLVAATAASNGQAVVDVNARVQQLASGMRTAVGSQEQLDAANARSNLQSLRSSRPVVVGLLFAVLALAAAVALTMRIGGDSGSSGAFGRAGDQAAARGGRS